MGYALVLNQSRGDILENPLQVGELVRLRSGGPVMTVAMVLGKEAEERVVTVVWHDRVGQEHTTGYLPELLVRARRRWGIRRWYGG